MADEEDIIIEDFKDKKKSLIHDDANWSTLDTLLKKATAIDDYLKEKVGKQNRYTDLAKKKIAAIKAQYTALKNRMNQYKQTIEQYESDKFVSETKITELTQKVTDNETKIDELTENAEAFDADGEEKKRQIEELTKAVERLTEENEQLKQQITDLKQQLADKQAIEEKLNQTIIEKDQEIAILKGEAETLKTQVDELQREIQDNGTDSGQRIEQLIQDKADAEKEKTEAQALIATLEAEKEQLRQEKEQLAQDKAAIEADLKTQQDEVTRLTGLITTLEGEKRELEARATAAEEAAEQLRNQLEQVTAQKDALEAEKAALEAESAQLSEKIESIRASLLALHKDEYNTLVDKLNEILADGDLPDDGNGGGGGGGSPLSSQSNSLLGANSFHLPPPGVNQLSGKASSSSAAAGGEGEGIKVPFDDKEKKAAYDIDSEVSGQQSPQDNRRLPTPTRKSNALNIQGIKAGSLVNNRPNNLTSDGLLTREAIEEKRKQAQERAEKDEAARNFAKTKREETQKKNEPEEKSIQATLMEHVRPGTIVYVKQIGSNDYKKGQVVGVASPSSDNTAVMVSYFKNDGTGTLDASNAPSQVSYKRIKYIPNTAGIPLRTISGGAYKSKKYRKLLNKKSRRSNIKTNNKKITKKRKNMRGGFIANYKTPSSSKGKTKKVKKSSSGSSGSSKTTTSSKR